MPISGSDNDDSDDALRGSGHSDPGGETDQHHEKISSVRDETPTSDDMETLDAYPPIGDSGRASVKAILNNPLKIDPSAIDHKHAKRFALLPALR